jgi:3-oxoacyl-[acyl-carrier protein] reductase
VLQLLLKEKTAVITGCMQGIGRTTMDVFVENGASVFACCQKETNDIKEHINKLQVEGYEITPLYFDLLDEDAIKQTVNIIQKTKKPIDILVNIAGVTDDALFHMLTMERLRKNFEVNFFSQVLFTQYITRLMLQNRHGNVINVSSISALDGNVGQVAYASSKAAFIGTTLTLSRELGPQNIRVNAVAPGIIDTAMTKSLPQVALTRQLNRSKLKRLGIANEVANVILFLASDASSYITGQIWRIDGGIG